ncbi:MAG: hypothetical protein V8T45_11870 [Oscillospiraceae bacterium]
MNQYTYCVLCPAKNSIFRKSKKLPKKSKKVLTKGDSGGILAKRLEGEPRNWQEMVKRNSKNFKNLLTGS